MFRIFNCEQGSDEWFAARGKLITASNFSKLVTKGFKESTQWRKASDAAIAGQLNIDDDIDNFQSQAMLRGQSLEHKALEFFNFTHGHNFKKTGLLIAKNDDGDLHYGASPDGIDVENKIGIELKCPLATTHIGYLLENKLPDDYLHQVHGSMLVTGYDKWIFGSYHPMLPCLMIVVERDEKYIDALRKVLDKCKDRISEYDLKFGGPNE